jgi:hypothetical protein
MTRRASSQTQPRRHQRQASLDVTLALVTEALSEFAVTINDVPNAILESVELLRSFLDEEGRFQVFSALDAHVFAQIVAATPAFGTSGADLIAQIRNGVATMRSTGANPDLLVLNPTTGGHPGPVHVRHEHPVFVPDAGDRQL